MNTDAYLKRIGVSGPIEPDLENLELLQRAHLTAVPFENLDVYARRQVRTDDNWTLSKVVDRRRGGWCFELNGAFASLLAALGYDVRRLAATVLMRGGSNAPMPTHLTIAVNLKRLYLVDVGFGDSFIRPLPLDHEGPHDGGTGDYSFITEGNDTTLVSWDEDGNMVPQYRFDRTPRAPSDFEAASVYLRTTPGLQWTQSRFATRLLDGGPDRVTLLNDKIKFRRDGVWEEHAVEPEDWDRLLNDWFQLTV
ncbi:MAG: arylamine N-acetyltransferase family protein [Actinomycetota bacterium]